jgi:hypothetical protein
LRLHFLSEFGDFMKAKYLLTAGLFGFVMAFAISAKASLQITIDDGSGPFTVSDGGAGDVNPLPGQILFVNTVGHTFSGFAALTISSVSNAPGTPVIAALNTTQLDVTASTSKSLSIAVLDNGFSLPGAAADALVVTNSLTGNYASGGSANASQTTEVDGVGTSPAAVSVSASNLNDTDETFASLVRGGPLYTLETLIRASVSANTSVNFTHTSSAVIPEPMTLAIWAGVFSVGALGIFRRQRNA